MIDNRWHTGNPDVDTWIAMQHAAGKHTPNCPDDCRSASVRDLAPHRPPPAKPKTIRTPIRSSVTVDLEQLLARWMQGLLPEAAAATYQRRAAAHLRAMSRPDDNQVTNTGDWPIVTRPGQQLDADQQRIRDRINMTAAWAYEQLAQHPEWSDP